MTTTDFPKFTADTPPWQIIGWLEASIRIALGHLEKGQVDRMVAVLALALASMP